MKFTSGLGSREGAGKVLKTISRQLKQRLQILIFLKSTLIDAASVYLRQRLNLGILMQYFKVLMPFVLEQ